MFSWILIRGFAKIITLRSRVMVDLLTWNAIVDFFRTVRSETCPCSVATLTIEVKILTSYYLLLALLFYLAVSSALER